jgi:DNA-binding MarR family transcriptional regulator
MSPEAIQSILVRVQVDSIKGHITARDPNEPIDLNVSELLILHYFYKKQQNTQNSPSYRDVATEIGEAISIKRENKWAENSGSLSISTVARHLNSLVKKNFLEPLEHGDRTMDYALRMTSQELKKLFSQYPELIEDGESSESPIE